MVDDRTGGIDGMEHLMVGGFMTNFVSCPIPAKASSQSRIEY